MRISIKEIMGENLISEIPFPHQRNMEELKNRVNVLGQFWPKPVTVSSGYRSMHEHNIIYSKINAERKKKGLPPVAVPMGSKHLSGSAVDLDDPTGELYDFMQNHPEALEKANVWCEKDTHGWLHIQSVPFGSYKPGGTRWFVA